MNPAFQATLILGPELAPAPAARPLNLPAWLRTWARAWRAKPAAMLDRSTGLYHRAGLMAAAGEAMQDLPAGSPVAVVVLDFADLREVCDIYGTPVARNVVGRLLARLESLAGWSGLVGRTGPAQFTVILPGATDAAATRKVQRVLGKPARIEFDAGDSEIVLVPDFVVDSTETDGQPVQALYRDMCRELARTRKEERRRLDYLAFERERHSRPMSLPPSR